MKEKLTIELNNTLSDYSEIRTLQRI